MSSASRRVDEEPTLIGVFLPNRGDRKISGCIDSLTFSHQPGLPTSVLLIFFIFGKFLQYLWWSHLPLVDSSSYQGAPFRCGAFAFFHMMLAPRLPLKIPRSTRVRESYSCKFGNAYSWTSLQRPPWVQKKSGHCKDEAVRREVFNKSQCMDFLSAGTKKSGLCQQQRILSYCQRGGS